MKQGRSNALLAELLAVVLFFALSATVLVRIYGAAYEKDRNADACAEALLEARSIADEVYAAPDAAEVLLEHGFEPDGDGIPTLASDRWELKAVIGTESADPGSLRVARVRILVSGEEVAELDASRYLPKGGAE